MSQFRTVLASMLLMACVVASAEADGVVHNWALTQYVHTVWPARLSGGTIPAIAQSDDGYVWLATGVGLLRFDGVSFTVFDSRNTPALKHDYLNTLIKDADGALWVGSYGGLTKYADGRFVSYSSKDGLIGNTVTALAAGRDRDVWIGTTAGLSHFHDTHFQSITVEDGLSSNEITALTVGQDGSVWIGTNAGLNRLANGRVQVYTRTDGLPGNLVRALITGRNGWVWIATDRGLARVADGRLLPVFTDALREARLATLYEDRDGSLWIGTTGQGVYRARSGSEKLEAFTSPRGLSSNDVMSIFEDREQSIWLGTSGGGLNQLRSAPFRTLSSEEGLSGDRVRAIVQRRDGTVWVGTQDGGVSRIEDGRAIPTYTVRNGLPSNTVRALAVGTDDSLWIGTVAGLARVSRGAVRVYTERDGLAARNIRSLAVDQRGAVWIGTLGSGLVRFHNGRFERYATDTDAIRSDAVIQSLFVDRSGTVWIGTDNELAALTDGRLRRYGPADGLMGTYFYPLHQSADGTVWFGSNGHGLSRFSHGRFRTVSMADGLQDDVVLQVVEDHEGNLWLPSNRGVFRIRLADLDAYDQHRVSAIPSRLYGVDDGLKNPECNGGSPPSLIAADGQLWFATMQGVAVLEPVRLQVSAAPPSTAIERMLVDGQTVDPVSGVTRPHARGQIEFSYAGLSFVTPGRVTFRYKLDGFDRDWIDAGTQRTARYTNLPPGTYTFQVMARSRDGLWGAPAESGAIWFEPRFHQTVYFDLLCVAGVLTLGLTAFRIRIARLERHRRELMRIVDERTAELRAEVVERQRTQQALECAKNAADAANRAKSAFVANISHEIRTPMNGVIGMADLVLETPLTPEQRECIETISVSGQSLLTRINDIQDLSTIESGRLDLAPVDFSPEETLAAVMKVFALSAHQKGLELLAIVDPDVPDALHGDSDRLRQVLMNLVGNAIQFTESGEVVVHMSVEQAIDDDVALRVMVRDTGVGIAPDKQHAIFEPFEQADGSATRKYGGTGLGLTISAKLVALMRGRIQVASEVGRGTEFEFVVRMGRRRRAETSLDTPNGLAGARVLIVATNATQRHWMSAAVAACGARVTGATDCGAARSLIEQAAATGWPFDWTLIDTGLRPADGFDLVEWARTYSRECGRVMMMITIAQQRTEATRLTALRCAWLTKPVMRHALRRAMSVSAAAASTATPARMERTGWPLRVLVAEDNVVNQRLAVRLLEGLGHSVVVAADGERAVACYASEPFDVVLMDVQMPKMNGLEATAAIRQLERQHGVHVPIIAVTANTMKGNREECLEAGMDGYVSKPVDKSDLIAALRQVVSERAQRQHCPA